METLGWKEQKGFSGIDAEGIHFDYPKDESPNSEYWIAWTKPETNLTLEGDGIVLTTLSNPVNFSGFYFNLGESNDEYAIILSEREGNKLAVALLTPDKQDSPYDPLGDVNNPGDGITVSTEFHGDTMSVFVGDNMVGQRKNDLFAASKKFGGIAVGNGDKFTVSQLSFQSFVSQEGEAMALLTTPTPIPLCYPGQSRSDNEGDSTIGLADFLEVKSSLEGEKLSLTMKVRELPEEITINQAEGKEGYVEYALGARIFNGVEIDPAKPDYQLALFHFKYGGEKTGPIEELIIPSVYRFSEDGKSSTKSGTGTITDIDYENNTITISATIPGITENSVLTYLSFVGLPDQSANDAVCPLR